MQNVRPRPPTSHRKVFARKWRPKRSIQLRRPDGGLATRSQIAGCKSSARIWGALFSQINVGGRQTLTKNIHGSTN